MLTSSPFPALAVNVNRFNDTNLRLVQQRTIAFGALAGAELLSSFTRSCRGRLHHDVTHEHTRLQHIAHGGVDLCSVSFIVWRVPTACPGRQPAVATNVHMEHCRDRENTAPACCAQVSHRMSPSFVVYFSWRGFYPCRRNFVGCTRLLGLSRINAPIECFASQIPGVTNPNTLLLSL